MRTVVVSKRTQSKADRIARVVLDHNWTSAKDWADAVFDLGDLSDRQIDQLQQRLRASGEKRT